MPARKMDGGYINEGGQLKTKNGQKYVVNHKPKGYFVSKGCIALMACATILALLAVFLLTYFLVVPRCDASTDSPANETVSSASIYSPSRGTVVKPKPPATEDFPIEKEEILSDQNYENFNSNEDKIHLYEGWNPTRYRLIIEPNFNKSINNGSVWIDVTSDPKVYGIQPIILDIHQIEVQDVRVLEYTEPNTTSQLDIEFKSDSNSTLWIYIKKDFRKHSSSIRLKVFVEFISQLSDTLQGFYRVNYNTSAESEWLASTQFSPIEARRAFPCMDRPDKKAEFEISIVRPYEKSMILSNMPHMFSNQHRPGYVQEDFHVTPKMSTYLVAFIVSDLVQSNSTTLNHDEAPRIRVWSRPEMSDMTGYVHKLSTEILPFFEDYFNIKFKLPKIDLVAVPDFGFSAMENWGLIFFRESAMLVPEDKERRSSAEHTEHVARILAHELAHQWFGNLVTPKWWSDLWLKEGFANYMSYLALDSVEPSWRSRDNFAVNELQHAMDKDADTTSHPISFEVSTPSDIRRIFDPISYSKGAALIRMMNSFLGEEAFVYAVRSYLKKFEYKNAVQNDLWKTMSDIGHMHNVLPPHLQVKDIMDTWTLQAGYPILNVTRRNNTIVITQQRYMLPKAKAEDKSRWYIPISYITQSKPAINETPTYWMTDRDDQIVIPEIHPEEWVCLNVNRTGYYRVQYDYVTLSLLSRNYQDLPEINKAQLIDDALNLARAEYVTYDIALTFLLRMSQHFTDVLPWAAATRGLEYITDMLIREPAFNLFRATMLHCVLPAYNSLGFDEQENETHVQLLHRARIVKLACTFGHDRCTNRAQYLFREWIRVPKVNNIKPNLKSTVYCVALREGGVAEWKFAYKQYLETTSASEKEVLLNALGCTRDPSLLSKYLNMTLYPEYGIRKQDGARAFSAVASNSVGFEIAFDFLQSNIEQISKYFGDGFSVISKMVNAATTYMNKDHHLAQFERFIAKARKLNLKSIESSVKLSIEQVKNNIYWRSRSYYQLQSYLEKLASDFHLNY